MSDPGAGPWCPPDDWWLVKALRFCNVLDDAKNILSPVKVNVWSANLASISTVFAGILAWVTSHWGMLDHVMSIAPVVGGYLGGTHTFHHFDKRERNLQKARMKDNIK
jgi:hypothetical protein